jgi:NhaB family Na+:H+ antiporter
MTTPEALYEELQHNFPVILLLMFMVAGIHFMKELLLFLFSRILLGARARPCWRCCSACCRRFCRRFSTR